MGEPQHEKFDLVKALVSGAATVAIGLSTITFANHRFLVTQITNQVNVLRAEASTSILNSESRVSEALHRSNENFSRGMTALSTRMTTVDQRVARVEVKIERILSDQKKKPIHYADLGCVPVRYNHVK